MRVSIRAVALAFGFVGALASGAAAQQASPKIVYINSQRILSEAPGRAEAESAFQRELNGYQAEVKRMGDSLKAMIASYEKSQVTLSPAAKDSRQKEIRAKEQEYQQRTNALDQKAAQREAELTRPILEKIQQAIEAERAANGYAFVLDAGSQAGVVVAADKSLDITEKVLARMKSMPNTAAAPATPPAAGQPNGAAAAPAGVTRPKNPPTNR
ncbi:MAG TPA: OmpH family outer membrane protein [Gemmatimonadaceae bacterium]|nr:OmpH family outer membrane protein [Gemmatimonadaceae bacterium]